MQHMVMEHRWMHAETLCYLLHQLDPALKRRCRERAPAASGCRVTPPVSPYPRRWASSARPNGEFGWDNEFPAHLQSVPDFQISKYKVTNREYLRFIEGGRSRAVVLATEGRRLVVAADVR